MCENIESLSKDELLAVVLKQRRSLEKAANLILDLRDEIGVQDVKIQGLEDKIADLEEYASELESENDALEGDIERYEEARTREDAYRYWRAL